VATQKTGTGIFTPEFRNSVKFFAAQQAFCMLKISAMNGNNITSKYPYSLEGDELGQRVYDSLRTPLANTSQRFLSVQAQERLRRAEAWYVNHKIIGAEPTERMLGQVVGKASIENLSLPQLNVASTNDTSLVDY
jgi:hypothetical protein